MRGTRPMACDVKCVSFTRRTVTIAVLLELNSFRGVRHHSAELTCVAVWTSPLPTLSGNEWVSTDEACDPFKRPNRHVHIAYVY